jgi:RNA polymerase sigma-70 factor (ECF subfamily)
MEAGELELELVREAAAGDEDAFRTLVDRHGRMVFQLAYRVTREPSTAEDVVQETFMRAHRALHRFDGRARFATWLHRIATNAALDALRQGRARQEVPYETTVGELHSVPSAEPDPERRARSGDVRTALEQAIATLSPVERLAFVLRHFEGCSTAEIAERLGTGASASRQAVFRAVSKLRRALSPHVEEHHGQAS